MRQIVDEFIIASAIGALAGFCKKNGVELIPGTVAQFAIAWREGGNFEFTPCARAFRRIYAIAPRNGRVALVFNYEGSTGSDLDVKLTDELNDWIRKATFGKWPPP